METMETMETCPLCNGYSIELGTLGNLTHYRCQDCGITFSEPVEVHCEDGYNRFGYMQCKTEATYLSLVDGMRVCEEHAQCEEHPRWDHYIRLSDLSWDK